MDIPKLEDVLFPVMYVRSDKEMVEILGKLYPFEKIDLVNQFYYDEILIHLSSEGWRYILPYLMEFFIEVDTDFSSNLSGTFERVGEGILSKSYPLSKTLINEMEIGERNFISTSLNEILKRRRILGLKSTELKGLLSWIELFE